MVSVSGKKPFAFFPVRQLAAFSRKESVAVTRNQAVHGFAKKCGKTKNAFAEDSPPSADVHQGPGNPG